jgi:hypothetical protein
MRTAAALENTDGAVATKTCTKCGAIKPIIEFSRCRILKDGRRNCCKQCQREQDKFYVKNPEVREHKRRYIKAWYERAKATDKYKQQQKQQQQCRRNRNKIRRKEDQLFQISYKIRSRLATCFKRLKLRKPSKTLTLLGCTMEQVLLALGPRPLPDAELDHICPLAQARNEDELIKLCHYSNLQWLPRSVNASKAHRWTLQGEVKCIELLGRNWIDYPKKGNNSCQEELGIFQ